MALRSHLIVSVRATRTGLYLSIHLYRPACYYNLLTRPSFRVSSAPLTGTLNAGRPSICLILRFARTLPTRDSLSSVRRLRSTRFTEIRTFASATYQEDSLPSNPSFGVCVINWILMFGTSFEYMGDEDYRVVLGKRALSFVNRSERYTRL